MRNCAEAILRNGGEAGSEQKDGGRHRRSGALQPMRDGESNKVDILAAT